MIKEILIIEDDKDMCNELTETFSCLGYHVATAFDGLTGKKLIKKNKYDVIVLDLKIPNFDGYQILNFINKKKIKSNIIVITARMKINFEDIINQDQEKKEDDLLKIANFVLLKPFKISELVSIVKRI